MVQANGRKSKHEAAGIGIYGWQKWLTNSINMHACNNRTGGSIESFEMPAYRKLT